MTFAQILADIYRRTGFASSPTADVVTRIKAFVNETQQEIFHEPGMEFLQNDTTSFSSVANQQTYGLPVSVAKIKQLRETTNRIVLLPISLSEYRERYPDPSAVTGTPTRWVDLGFDAVDVEPSDASAVYVVSSSNSDVGTAYIEGLRSGGVPFTDSVTMTGATAVQLPSYSDVVSITKFYISTAAVGTVRLREDSGSGTILATIPVGYSYSRYRRIALAPTPAAVISYSLDFERNFTELVNDTDQPLLPEQFHHMLAIGGRMKEYEKTQDSRYGVAKDEYEKALKKLKFWLYEQTVGTANLRGPRISRPSIMDGGSIPATGGSSSSPLAVTSGGTGFSSYSIGDLLYADTTTTLAKLSAVADGRILRAFGVGVAPQWSTLTIPNTLSANRILYATAASVLGSSASFTFDGSTLALGAGIGLTVGGSVTLGDAAADTLTLAGTIVSDLLFTDATFDIGKSGATRPRDLFLSRNATVGGTLGVTGVATFTAQSVHSAGVDLSSNGQVVFPATQNASAVANTLDDYEEGSWTPVVGGGGGTSGQTYSTQVGRYVKIGQLVIAYWAVVFTAKGTITTNAQLQGLPFTSQNVSGLFSISPVRFGNLATSFASIIAVLLPNTTTANLESVAAGGAANTANVVTGDINNNSEFSGCIVYRATA